MTGQVLRNNFDLNDKYTLIDGKVVLSGIQALVRLLLDQHRADLIAVSYTHLTLPTTPYV